MCLAVFVAAAPCPPPFFLLLCSCLLAWLPSAVLAVCLPLPPPLLLFVLLVSRCSASRALSVLLCFPPGRPLLLCGCLCLVVFVAAARCSNFFFLLACLALVGRSRRLLPPPLPVRARCLVLSVAPCAVWCCRAALSLSQVLCGAVLPCSALRVVLWCLALCYVALLVAAAFCAVSLVLPSGWVVRGVVCCLVLVSVAVRCAVLCVPACGAAPPCCVLCRAVMCCCAMCCFVALVWCRCLLCVSSGAACRPAALPWALRFAVFPRAVCSVLCVSCRGVLGRAIVRRCALCCVCFWGVVLCVPCPLRPVPCCAPLCWCAWAVLFVRCVLLLAPGAVVRCCVL